MADPSNISSAHSHVLSHDYEAGALHALFAHEFDFQTTDHEMINKYAINIFNLYAAANDEDFNLWEYISTDFGRFEARHFDKFRGSTWKIIKNYCYLRGYWIDNKTSTTRTTAMLEAIAAEWNNKWTLE